MGLSTDPSTYKPALGETKSTAILPANLVDFTAQSDPNLYGTSTAYLVLSGKNVLWSGNANGDGKVKYSGVTNDPSSILTQALAFPGNTTGLYNYNNAVGYFSGDVNMDGKVKYSGLTNDPAFILNNIVAYPSNTTGLYNYNNFNQQIPN